MWKKINSLNSPLFQQSPTFLVPGDSFVEDNFFSRMRGGEGDGFVCYLDLAPTWKDFRLLRMENSICHGSDRDK